MLVQVYTKGELVELLDSDDLSIAIFYPEITDLVFYPDLACMDVHRSKDAMFRLLRFGLDPANPSTLPPQDSLHRKLRQLNLPPGHFTAKIGLVFGQVRSLPEPSPTPVQYICIYMHASPLPTPLHYMQHSVMQIPLLKNIICACRACGGISPLRTKGQCIGAALCSVIF